MRLDNPANKCNEKGKAMSTSETSAHVLIAGDATQDLIAYRRPNHEIAELADGKTSSQNWRSYPTIEPLILRGGCDLLFDFIRQRLGDDAVLQLADKETAGIQSKVLLKVAKAPEKKDPEKTVWRIDKYEGYTGPESDKKSALDVPESLDGIRLLVIDDAGNEFRYAESTDTLITRALAQGVPLLIKLSRPLDNAKGGEGKLIPALRARSTTAAPVILSMDMWTFRAEGLPVSRGLSWERTAADFAAWIRKDAKFASLCTCADFIVVRLSLEGVLIFDTRSGEQKRRDKDEKAPSFTLIYDPSCIEGDLEEKTDGRMVGYSAAFTASLAASLSKGVRIAIQDVVAALRIGSASGLIASRDLLAKGYGPTQDGKKRLVNPAAPSLSPSTASLSVAPPTSAPSMIESTPFAIIQVPDPATWWTTTPPNWTILGQKTSTQVVELAIKILNNKTKPDAEGVPVARFGGLCAVDRWEIEGYRSIRGLMREYLDRKSVTRPLCVAVFGQPGCGKSFGVKAIAESVFGKKPDTLTFNMSEFIKVEELTRALHLVHDKARDCSVPLIFFDEFDSMRDGKPLGWLKHYLAPMQDGTFRDGEHEHPIGKAIFVFAGGTSHSFASFSQKSTAYEKTERENFIQNKGPDFLSRLRGYADVLGPTQRSPSDFGAMLRRAIVFGYNLKKQTDEMGETSPIIQLENPLAYALLRVSGYHHGLRSLDAILDMSRLSVIRGLVPSALPSSAQLSLHLNAEEFFGLMASYSELSEKARLDLLAPLIHNFYRETQWQDLLKKDAGDVHEEWDKLGNGYQDSNLQQANQLPTRILKNGYTIVPKTAKSNVPAVMGFTPRQLRKLAIEEHDRWIAEKNNSGWRYAPIDKKEPSLRLHPLMIAWDRLPIMERKKDLDAIGYIPDLLSAAGLSLIDIDPPDSIAHCPWDDGELEKQVSFQVRAVIQNKAGLILLTRQVSDNTTVWDLPGGAVAYDEHADRALIQTLFSLFKQSGVPANVTAAIRRFAGSMPFETTPGIKGNVTDALYYECVAEQLPDGNLDGELKWIAPKELTVQQDVPSATRQFVERWNAGVEFRKTNGLLP
jgi:ADP-ribose pyrophosphatase YjhB (NUDIX family)